jgi:hypothetical protein
MSTEALQESGTDRFGSRKTAVFVLFSPALLWAGQYVSQPALQHYYRNILNILPIWVPMLALFWAAALVRLFWPDRLPGPLAYDSAHRKTAVRVGRGLFWGAAVGLAGALLASFAGLRATSRLMHFFGLGSCMCLGAGFAVREYVKFRREPGTSAASSPDTLFMLPILPVLLFFLGMMLIASWGEPGWTMGIGTLFVVLLLLFLRMLKQERARRRDEKEMGRMGDAPSPGSGPAMGDSLQ